MGNFIRLYKFYIFRKIFFVITYLIAMESANINSVLLSVIILLLTTIGGMLYKKLEEFSKTIQDILLNDMKDKKDIERIDYTLEEHHERIGKLEDKK
jgi:hypothetical protein